MIGLHHYYSQIKWTGNNGNGTSNYKSYERDYSICINNKAIILGSSDQAFRGDNTKHNPEELLLASLSSCHMLWYLHLCSEAGIVVVSYTDNAKSEMKVETNGSGRFLAVFLIPEVTVTESSMVENAEKLHKKANEMCFIANSVNFHIYHQPIIKVKNG